MARKHQIIEDPCPNCGGAGRRHDLGGMKCSACGGRGRMIFEPVTEAGIESQVSLNGGRTWSEPQKS